MTKLEKDSNHCSWPFFYGDKHYNGFPPRPMGDSYSTYDKEVTGKTMLKHEAVFKSQIYELHNLYRKQRNLMDDLRRKESNRSRTAIEELLSSSPLASQITYEDARRSQMPEFPFENNRGCVRTSVSVVEDINHFILNSKRGSNCQSGPSQNGYGLKDVEVLENRPVKVRRKLIDLHLPADAYIDTEETIDAVCGRSNGNVIKEAQGDSLRPGSGLRSTNCLADLNEPFKNEENNAFALGYSQVSCNGEIRGLKQSDGRKRQRSLNSLHEKEPLRMNFPHSDHNGYRRGWQPQVLGTGNCTGSQKSASLFLQPEKFSHSSQSIQVQSNILHERQHSSIVNASDVCSWKEREFIDLEANPRNGGIIREHHLENSNSSLACKSLSAQRQPFLNSPEILSVNAKRVGRFGDRWRYEYISRMNSVASSVSSNQKGFDHGSSSFSKEYLSNRPSIGYNHQNSRKDYDRFPKNFKNHFFKDSNRRETLRDLNLNVEFSKNSISEARDFGEQPGPLPWLQPKPSCNGETIRLKDLNSSYSSVLSSSMTNLDDTVRTLDRVWSQSLKSVYYSNNVEPRKIEANDCSANRKVFDSTIADKTCYKDRAASPKLDLNRDFDINLPSEPAFPVSVKDLSIDSRADPKISASFRHQIDLNLSVCEDEDSFSPLSARSDMNVPAIDLEVPTVHEIKEFKVSGENSLERPFEKAKKSLDEVVQMSAEAMFDFSSSAHNNDSDEVACSSQQASENFLHLFAETIKSYGENLDRNLEAFSINKRNGVNRDFSSLDETDYFESITLKLAEMKEEEYMPKPMIPENLKSDETGRSFLPSQRPRRGNARRGRPRRDFQRDTLPGLASLARHEVTEDIQTFCGLMRATGHDWSAGLSRRKNGSKRGRPRLVMANPHQSVPSPQNPVYPSPPPQPLNNNINLHNNIRTGLEDKGITGWGKMTRRPRRQRCPPGNNRTHVPLT